MRTTLVRLAAVVLAAAFVATTLTGFVTRAEPGETPVLRLPAASAGDAADYDGPEGATRVLMEGLGAEQDAAGRHVLAWTLSTQPLAEGPRPSASSYVDGAPLLLRVPTGEEAGLTAIVSENGRERQSEQVTVFYSVTFGVTSHLCGLPDGPGVRELALEGDVPLAGDCGGPVRHVSSSGGRHTFANKAVRVTFEDGMPFPAEVVTEGSTTVLRKAGHVQIDAKSQELEADRPLPPVELAPADRLGPDASGIPQDVDLAAALKAAREDMEEPGVRDYVAAHADWFVAAAASGTSDDGKVMTWDITLDSSGPALRVAVHRMLPDSPPLPIARPGSPVPLKPPVGLPYPANDGFVVYVFDAARDLPALPGAQQLPAVSSVAGAWRAYTASDDTVLDWAFAVSCPDPCSEFEYQVRAGNASSLSSYGGGQGTGTFRWVDTMLVVDGAGRVVGRQEGHVEETRSEGPAPILGVWSGNGPGPAPEPRPLRLAGTWTPPGAAATAGITIASLLAGAGYLAAAAVKSGGLAGLFSRVHGPAVREHPVRRRILAAVEAQPGIHHQALLRACELGRGALDHHLRKLEDAGAIVRRRSGGYTCVFLRDAPPAALAVGGSLKSEGARRIWAAVQRHPGAPAGVVAEAARLDPSTVTHHIRRLQEAGLVEARRSGRTVTLHPKAGVTSAA